MHVYKSFRIRHNNVFLPYPTTFEISQVAAKIEGGGSKRPLEDAPEPSAKKLASVDSGYQPQQQMRLVFN